MSSNLPEAAEAFLLRWTPTDTELCNMRADLAALLETVRAAERERAAAHIDADFSRPGREFAAAIRGMEGRGANKPAWEIRSCATLGTNWRDVYRDGVLWAMQVPATIAEAFVAEPHLWGNSHASEALLRGREMEREGEVLEPGRRSDPGRAGERGRQ